jgi:hypothetical protein
MGQDAPCPNSIWRLRRAAEGFGCEHGEHGDDPPLARSEHRGPSASWDSESYPQRKVQFLLKFRFRVSQLIDIRYEKRVSCEETGGLL